MGLYMAETRQVELTEAQKERFKTIQQVLKIQIDGDWDEEMIQTAFDSLEKMLFGEAIGKDEPEVIRKRSDRPPPRAKARKKISKT